MTNSLDTFGARASLTLGDKTYSYFSLPKFAEATGIDIGRLPYSLKILLENLLRSEDGKAVRRAEITSLSQWDPAAAPNHLPHRSDAQEAIATTAARFATQWGGGWTERKETR